MSIRVGFGKDIHKLVFGKELILGGVKIPFEKGEEATSDGDVVYHALSDALLGAAALGDIGKYFPSSDPRCKGMNSSEIVSFCFNEIKKLGYKVVNIDISIELENPKIAKYIDLMKLNISDLCELSVNDINIKGMTNEGQDSVGNGESVVCYVSLLIEK